MKDLKDERYNLKLSRAFARGILFSRTTKSSLKIEDQQLEITIKPTEIIDKW